MSTLLPPLVTFEQEGETMIGSIKVVTDDIGYHVSSDSKSVTVHFIRHLPEAIQEVSCQRIV